MYLRSSIVFVLTLANFILAREIISRLDADDSDIRIEENINEAVTNVVVDAMPSNVAECVLSRNARQNVPNVRIDSEETERRIEIENQLDDSLEAPMTSNQDSKPEIKNVIFGPNVMNSRNPFFEGLDKLRQIQDNHDDLDSSILRLVDPILPPQSQFVDNTLRLMAIKSSVDDLADKLFPNLRSIQHALDSHRK